MPNHITNILEFEGSFEDINELIETFGTYHEPSLNRAMDDSIICRKKGEDGFNVGWYDEHKGEFKIRADRDSEMDYKSFDGLPEDWEFEVNDGFLQMPDFNNIIEMPEDVEDTKGDSGMRPAWYEWSIENWGTKWNSYSHKRLGINKFKFETAWSDVSELIREISKEFPEVHIKYQWADEDTGYNVGEVEFLAGMVQRKNVPEGGSKKAYELVFEIKPEQKQFYVYNEGTGEYDYREN